MKKNATLWWAALLLVAYNLDAQSPVLLLADSSHYRYFDPETGNEQFSAFHYNEYNDDDLVVIERTTNIVGGIAQFFRADNTYNNQNLLMQSVSHRSTVSPDGPWENWLMDDYTYDSQGRTIHYIGRYGQDSTGWIDYYQETFGFDDAAPADSSVYQLWNTSTLVWDNYRSHFNYYNQDKVLTLHVDKEWDANTLQWKPLNSEQYSYYPDGKLKIQVSSGFSGLTTVRTDSFLYRLDGRVDSTFTNNKVGSNTYRFVTKWNYDAQGNLIDRTTIKWLSGNLWAPSSRQEFAPGNPLYTDDFSLENQSTYNANTQQYDVLWEIGRAYFPDGNDRVLFVETQKQRNSQLVLVQQIKDSVWYHIGGISKTGVLRPDRSVDCRFANPYRSGTGIVCQSPDQNSLLQLRLTDLTGRMVAQAQVLPGENWTPSGDWPAGLYQLGVWQRGKFLGTKKIVIVR